MSASWFKFPIGHWDDPRLFRLKRAIGESALWIPIRIWSYAVVHAPDGSLGNVSPEEVADAIRYDGDATTMFESLRTAGYLDASNAIVGWEELFALARSRQEAARKAGLESGSKRKKRADEKRADERENRIEAHVQHDVERHVQRDAPGNAPAPFPWSSVDQLPEQLRAKLHARYPFDSDQADVLQTIRGREITFKARHTVAEWHDVFVAQVEREHQSDGPPPRSMSFADPQPRRNNDSGPDPLMR